MLARRRTVWTPGLSPRVVVVGVVVDYVAFAGLVAIGAAFEGVSMFYALASPVRGAPLFAGAMTGALAGHGSLDRPLRVTVVDGLLHGGAVVALVLGAGVAGTLTRTAVWFVLPLLVLVIGGKCALTSQTTSTCTAASILLATILVALLALLPLREPLGLGLSLVALLSRCGAYVFLLPAEFGRGWTLTAVWAGLFLLGSALGGLYASQYGR
jgi:hypothetical protein